MILQFLINHYQEPEEIVGRLLSSIQNQEGISKDQFEVLIYSDGTDNKLSSEFLESFDLTIRYRALEHRGVCTTRNALMDDATANYIMFCDADDEFHSKLGLYKLLKAIQDLPQIGVIGSPYECESCADGKLSYRTLKNDTIRLHGKIFKRSYLLENNIRFPDEMTFSGDMYFLWLAYNLQPNHAWMKDSFYTWKYYGQSVTRKDPMHRLRTYGVLLKNYRLLYENLLERGRQDLCEYLAAAVCQMMYVNETNEDFMDGPKALAESARKAMAAELSYYDKIYEEIPEKIQKEIYQNTTLAVYKEGKNCSGVNGISSWMKKMQERYRAR